MFPGHPNSKRRLASYLMEQIYFEAQLCSEILTLKEQSTNEKTAKNRVAGGVNGKTLSVFRSKCLTSIGFGRTLLVDFAEGGPGQLVWTDCGVCILERVQGNRQECWR